MESSFSKRYNKGPGPERLFVGGLHGKETYTTIQALTTFEDENLKNGKLTLCNLPESQYISTLNRDYYETSNGRRLLNLIKKIKPSIYLELHCYHRKSRAKLTSKDRLKKSGVPSLVKLENDVLIGSISPIIRSVYFGQYDFPFILEIPCHPSEASLRIYKDMMNLVASSRDRFEIFMKLEKFYPQQADRLRNYFIEYSDNFFILFKKTIKYACENHSTTPEDLEIFIKSMVNELDLKINDIQLNQVAEAVLIFSNKEL